MRAIVSDVNILNHLQPQQVEVYLTETGWHERSRIPDRVSIWTRDTYSEDHLKVQLPVEQDFDDYSLRMSEIMETLEKAENRSQLDILSELITTAPDITIQGLVTQVNVDNTELPCSEVTLVGIVVDQLRKIKTILSNNDYILAVKAYQERSPLVIQGDLIKEDNDFVLKNPRNVTLKSL
jgi:hypothetical protein